MSTSRKRGSATTLHDDHAIITRSSNRVVVTKRTVWSLALCIERTLTNFTPKPYTRPKPKNPIQPLRFLALPPELRNEIYRLVLVTENVTKREPNPAHHSSCKDTEPMIHNYRESISHKPGTVRTHSLWLYSLDFQLSLLRVNRQIYDEASGIFAEENPWIFINTTKKRLSQDLRDHGYGVIRCGGEKEIRQMIKFPVVEMSIYFPRPHETRAPYQTHGPHRHDGMIRFAVSTAGINQLPRALWTLKHSCLMGIFYDTSPNYTRFPKAAREVVNAFSRLQKFGIPHPILPSGPKCRVHLPHRLRFGTTESDIHTELQHALTATDRYTTQGKWQEVENLCEASLAYLTDCSKIHGRTIHTSTEITQSTAAIVAALAIRLQQAKFLHKDYKAAIKYCSYVLMLRQFQVNGTNIISFGRSVLARILMNRGQAYLGLRQGFNAMGDFLQAQILRPGDDDAVREFKNVMLNHWDDPKEGVEQLKNLRVSELVSGMEEGDREGAQG